MSCCGFCFPYIPNDEHALFTHTPPSTIASAEEGNRNLISNLYSAPLEPPIPLSFPARDLQTSSKLPITQSNSSEGITKTVPENETWPVSDLLDIDLKKDNQETRNECSVCLEEYEPENPRLLTKCGHDFHLACILEWMERSETCPVCAKELILAES